MSEQGIVVNKYGAVDVEEIMRLRDEIKEVAKENKKLFDFIKFILEFLDIKPNMYGYFDYLLNSDREFLNSEFKKMKELTKADDYEYQITSKLVKLVKKQKERIKHDSK